ncbi:MAG TPA: flagellar hook-associated protein FlgL [Burkholderiaceae bacterium]|nr:flagellar hook-associated protein FlgL [Burkholderiaceae bacterium]
MRIATSQMFQRGIDAMLNSQSKLDDTQHQLSTGKRVNVASDDPLSAAQAERTRADLARMTAAQRALDTSRHAMSQADNALATGVDLLQRARESIIAAGNGAYGDAERQSLAQELRGLRNQLLTVANRDDGAGGWLFGGQGTSSAPFADTPSGVTYSGVATDRTVGSLPSALASIDGRTAWMTMPEGNGTFATASSVGNSGGAWIDAGEVLDATQINGDSYRIDITVSGSALTYSVTDVTTATTISTGTPFTSGNAIDIAGQRVRITGMPVGGDSFTLTPAQPRSVFDTLDNAIALLTTPGLGGTGQLNEGLARAGASLGSAQDRAQLVRTRIGEQLRSIEGDTDSLAARGIEGQSRLSELQDLDLGRAISDFQVQQNAVQAAMQTYTKVAGLSLFDFLR